MNEFSIHTNGTRVISLLD